MKLYKSDKDSIETTAKALRNKKVVIIPTDTVYGFSGIIPETDEIIRKIKGRSETKPFIQLISSPEDIFRITNITIPKKLLSNWPGPLTIIVPLKNSNTTVAVRCPGDEWLRKVINLCGKSIYSTSVNRSNTPVLTRIDEIVKEFSCEVELIIDDGDKPNALPSTIVKLENDGNYSVIRQGTIVI